ncbi:C2H2 type zinc finger domain protein [Beauveria bassiana ARSEF 2860]|uniref:C2H2 type zinc finger domain protein n=1 Tax=Beauveria bassiana (strain ARSEF 2860) TaxID=655819 RepID=J4KN98_BEAB2|nr:C2H2 type zinc finger domain protein [Beauveria bassiana ARSEF 2860]EJP65329.1 C2H2 type zinc finger domain protein [Beauveria bassiana ARSEF 2860]
MPIYVATKPHQTYPNIVSPDSASGRFRCLYCAKEFGRGDVCRKHMLNCIEKDADSVVPELRRGRKPKACEACFVSKVSCDKGHPCSRCLLRHLSCRPRNVVVDGARRSALPKTQVLPRSSQSAGGCRASDSSGGSDTHAEESMCWIKIKSAVDPRAASMLEHMSNDHSAKTERIPDMSFLGSSGGQDHSNAPQASVDTPDLMELWPWDYASMLDDPLFNFDGAYDITMLSLNGDPFTPIPDFSPSSAEGIENTSLLLVNALQDMHVELCTSDSTYQKPFHVPSVSASLSAANLKRFAAAFSRLRGFEAT